MRSVSSSSTLSRLLIRLWHHVGRRRRTQFLAVLALMFVSAFAEVVSLGSVLPFLGILVAPAKVLSYPLTGHLARAWGIDRPEQLVLPLTIIFVVAALISGAIRTFVMWCITRLSYGVGAELSTEVYRRTLYQPYSVHVARNSSEVLSGITIKVLEAVNTLYLLLLLISSLLSGVVITLALVAVDPIAAAIAIAGFGAAYALVMRLQRRRLLFNSERIAREHTHVVKAIQEGLGGIRDVLLDGTQAAYCEVYRAADSPLRRAQGNNIFISQSPRFAMETAGLVMIAVLAFGLSRRAGGVAMALPVLGTLGIGAQRVLPLLQQIYSSSGRHLEQ